MHKASHIPFISILFIESINKSVPLEVKSESKEKLTDILGFPNLQRLLLGFV